MKKIVILSSVLLLLLAISPLSVFASATETEPVQLPDERVGTSFGFNADTALLGTNKLTDNVESAFLYEVSSGTYMYGWNQDLPMDPASLVKIMTALIALEEGDISQVITAKEEVLSTVPYYAVSAELLPKEEMTLMDLLYCMMVGSANDAAAVIADYISGSQEAFVERMNTYAQELGCTNTQFKNAHGLYDEQQYTTARDMGRILSAAIENETFLKIFSTASYIVPATNLSEERELVTGNHLISTESMKIYFDERVVGGRTGVAEDGTQCLASYAETESLRLISIVMGAESVFAEDGYTTKVHGGFKETTTLLDAGFNGYKFAHLMYKDQVVYQCAVKNGENDVALGIKTELSAVLPSKAQIPDLAFRYNGIDSIVAPVDIDTKVGTVEVWYGTMRIASADLYAMNQVRAVNNDTINAVDSNNSGTQVIGDVLLWVVLAVLVVMLLVALLRFVPKYVVERRAKKYRRNRRRSR